MFKLIEEKSEGKIGVKRINLMTSALSEENPVWSGLSAVAGSGYFAQKFTLTATYRIWDMRSWKGHRDWIHPNQWPRFQRLSTWRKSTPWERNESLGIAEGLCLSPRQSHRKKGNDEAISFPIPHMFQCHWKMPHICVLMLASASNYSRMSSTAPA